MFDFSQLLMTSEGRS